MTNVTSVVNLHRCIKAITVEKYEICMKVYSRLVTGKFPDFNATAAMVSKVLCQFSPAWFLTKIILASQVEAGAEPEKILKHSPSSCTIL